MRHVMCLAAATTTLLTAGTAWGQESPRRNLDQAVVDWLENGNVVGLVTVVLIFGTGLVFALGWAIAAVVSSFRAQAGSGEEALEKLDAIEARIATIERAIANRQV